MKKILLPILMMLVLVGVASAYYIGPGINNLNVTMNSTFITFEFRDVWSGQLITGQNITMCDNNIVNCASTLNGILYSSPDPYTQHNWTITINSTVYNGRQYSANFTPLQVGSVPVYLGPVITYHFMDEKTQEPFNMSAPTGMRAQVTCSDGSTYETVIPTGISAIANWSNNITCNATSQRFLVDFGTLGNYYRNIVLTPSNSSFDYEVWLLNAYTTTIIPINLQIYDLFGEYQDASIYVTKYINGQIEQITSDYVDVQNQITAYLIQNQIYIITVKSSTKPDRIIGNLLADTASTKIIRLFDVTLTSDYTIFNSEVSYAMYIMNNQTIYTVYNDSTGQNIQEATWTIYDTDPNGAVLSTATSTSSNAVFAYNLPANQSPNQVYYVRLAFNSSTWGEQYVDSKTFQKDSTLADPTVFENAWTFRWILFIVMLIIALSLTIRTANVGSMLLVGLAGFLMVIGWLIPAPILTGNMTLTMNIASGVLGLAGLVALAGLLKEGAVR